MSDLTELSAAATDGKWGVEGGVITTLPSRVGTGVARECGMHNNWQANRNFIVALVNAYRAGRLVEASPSGPPAEDLTTARLTGDDE